MSTEPRLTGYAQACPGHLKWQAGPVGGAVAGRRLRAAKTHLVRVQEGMADDVLTDVGRRGQTV